MPKKASDIEFLPPGWQWVPAGKERWSYEDAKGVTHFSTARHGRRGNEVLSTRQVQNYQRARRAEQQQPKAPTVHRTGKIRTIKGTGPRGKKNQTDVTRSTTLPTGVGTMYNVERHGYSETYVFRTFEEAQYWALTNKVPGFAAKDGMAILQIRFTDRLNTTDRTGSDETDGPGYATLCNLDAVDLFFGNNVNLERIGTFGVAPWEEARSRIDNYDMSGQDARVYIYVVER